MANTFLIKHGSSAPTSSNLQSYELGFSTSTNSLYLNNGSAILRFQNSDQTENKFLQLSGGTLTGTLAIDGDIYPLTSTTPRSCGTSANPWTNIYTKKLTLNGVSLLDYCYPVGSIYLSVAAASPATWLGGTWEQIKGRFLLAADGTYGAGTTGGEAAHALSIDEMPKHNHGYEVRSPLNNQSGAVQHGFADYNNSNWWAGTWSYVTAAGGGQPHNNMPPYLAVYMWKRTA